MIIERGTLPLKNAEAQNLFRSPFLRGLRRWGSCIEYPGDRFDVKMTLFQSVIKEAQALKYSQIKKNLFYSTFLNVLRLPALSVDCCGMPLSSLRWWNAYFLTYFLIPIDFFSLERAVLAPEERRSFECSCSRSSTFLRHWGFGITCLVFAPFGLADFWASISKISFQFF